MRTGAFHLAGEISDGAISWVYPVPYLLEKSLPALRAGAAKSGRPVPPLVAGIPVALSQDQHAVLRAARFNELLDSGFDELLVMNMQIADPEIEQVRLSRLIGQM